MTPEQKKVVDKCEGMLLLVFPREYAKITFNLHPEGCKVSTVERFGKGNQ